MTYEEAILELSRLVKRIAVTVERQNARIWAMECLLVKAGVCTPEQLKESEDECRNLVDLLTERGKAKDDRGTQTGTVDAPLHQ